MTSERNRFSGARRRWSRRAGRIRLGSWCNKNGSTAERRNLHITGTGSVISDADASVPRSGTPNLRRVEVTDHVRDWVEHGLPNFGFVLMGDERFGRPSRRNRPRHPLGAGHSLGELPWGLHRVRVVFAPIGQSILRAGGRRPLNLD